MQRAFTSVPGTAKKDAVRNIIGLDESGVQEAPRYVSITTRTRVLYVGKDRPRKRI